MGKSQDLHKAIDQLTSGEGVGVAPVKLTDVEIDESLKQLHLANMRLAWRATINHAEHDAWSYHDFLTHLITSEIAGPQINPRRNAGKCEGRRDSYIPSYLNSTPEPNSRPGSAAERWAMYVLRGCQFDRDPKTIEDWARSASVSYSGLCESCRLLSVQPRDARDLTRVLRVVLICRGDQCRLEVLLDVSDRRTRKAILEKAGLARSGAGQITSVDEFLRGQRFIAVDNEGLKVLRSLVTVSAET